MLSLCWAPWSFGLQIELNIFGVDDKIKQNIEAHLSLNQTTGDRDLTLTQIQLLHRRAHDEIQAAVQPYGYYHATIDSQIMEGPESVTLNYSVTLNEPTLVDDINFKLLGAGLSNPNLKKLSTYFILKPGDIFDHDLYEKGKGQLQQKAYQEGYIQAYFKTHQVAVDLSTHLADITLELETGPQYTFGPVTFKTPYYHEAFLSRFTQFEADQPYRLETLVDFESKLMQSGLFKSVDISPTVTEQSSVTPLTVTLKDAPANRYLIGIGYDTNTRSRLRLGWDRRKINPQGHQFKSQFKLSEKDTLLDASYIIPGQKPWVDNYRITFGYADDEYRDKPSELYTFELSETREIWDLKRTIAIRYLNETFRDSDQRQEHATFVLPSLRLSKSKLDNMANPRNGYKAEFFVRGGVDALFSDADFIQFYLQYKWLKGLSTHGTFIAKTELGFTLPDDIDKLPLSVRFYAGGIDSLRGFRYRSLPFEIDDEGQLKPVGGGYLALASLEYNHTLFGPLKGAVFVDGGSAFRDIKDDWQLSAGFGLRWETPIGPLKLDLAKPLSSGAEVWRLHFSFGPQI